MNIAQYPDFESDPFKSLRKTIASLDTTNAVQQAMASSGILDSMRVSIDASNAAQRILANSGALNSMRASIASLDTTNAVQQAMASSGILDSMRVSIDASNAAQRILANSGALNSMRSVLASSEMSTVYTTFIEQLKSSSIDEMIDEIVQDSSEAALEQLGERQSETEHAESVPDEGREWVDPVRHAIFEKSAEWSTKIQNRYPTYSDRAVYAINKIVENSVASLISQLLPVILIACFGVAGLAASCIISGAARFVSAEQKKKMSPNSRSGIGIECPTCRAIPNMWCITVRGSNPGNAASKLHKARTQ